jgi:hypothetical protein
MSDDTAEKLRHVDKSLRREKKGGGSRSKDDSTTTSTTVTSSQHNKDRRAQQKASQAMHQRIPRTCGVLFKLDKNGNYINVDRCEADNGYGAHRVPGGRVRNPVAHAKLQHNTALSSLSSDGKNKLIATAESYSFRNDPRFVQHQTEFEAQQQKILEDAWASLVETDEQQHDQHRQEHDHAEVEESNKSRTAKAKSSIDDEYAAALAMSPSMIGLNFDQNESSDSIMLPPSVKSKTSTSKIISSEPSIDLPSFAFANNDAASATTSSANPFGAGLWGNAVSGGNDLGALSGWDFTSTSTTSPTEKQNEKAMTSKLNLWGSSVLDSPSKEKIDESSGLGG